MVVLHFAFVLTLSILPIGSEGSGNEPGENEIQRYINSSTNSDQSTASTESKVVFIAFNRKNPNGTSLTLETSESELKSILLQNTTTKFITHGWLGSETGVYQVDLRTAYMKKHDINLIAVGWSKISRNEYTVATLGVPGVGDTVGKMVSNILKTGLVTSDRIHLVGHSLGAHVMGIAGSRVSEAGHEKVGRITGLDPARPGYEDVKDASVRLDINDGEFVDIIHTSGVFGYRGTLGHADFYPNGGHRQPGCPITRIFCSHLQALVYFRESIENELAFPSVKCDSYSNFVSNQCEGNEIVFMGEPTPSSARGVFYLRTSNNRMEVDKEEVLTEIK